MDVGVYVTSLRCLKNLLLVTDAVKSVWFVAFQEDPFKLTVLSKETSSLRLCGSEFFFEDSEFDILSVGIDGVLRLHAYDPSRTFITFFSRRFDTMPRLGIGRWNEIIDDI